MDLKRIFVKDACPTKTGGQAVLDGIMMKGPKHTSVAVRLPDERIYIKIDENKEPSKLAKIPFIRGVFVFVGSLVQGTKTLMDSAEIVEKYSDFEDEEEDKVYGFLERKFGEKGAWNIALYTSVIIAILFSVGIFIIGPTFVVNLMKRFTENAILLNLIEGVLRIILFVLYIAIIARMKEIKTTFMYHGAEHKTIHCYESRMELTPENAQSFYRLHPRCGTSFLMFVMVIALILFSLLGWPNLIMRIVSRILLLPVIASISYELLRWAGRSDNIVVKILSMPGILLQKLTTREPEKEHLEVAIAAMKAVSRDDTVAGEGFCDLDGYIIEPVERKEEDQ